MTAQILTTTRELHSRVSDGIHVRMLGRLSARSCRSAAQRRRGWRP